MMTPSTYRHKNYKLPLLALFAAASIALTGCGGGGGSSDGGSNSSGGSSTAPAPTPTPTPAPTPAPEPTPAPAPAPAPSGQLRAIPHPLYGVTIDAVDSLPDIVDSLKSLHRTPTTRIVFDEHVAASYYKNAVDQIQPVSFIMGELLDSFYMPEYNLEQYKARTTEYLNAFGNKVDIWEIGNEINGEWLGSTESVVPKMSAAYDLVKQKGGRTALTLYYNEDCWEKADHEMFTWTEKNVPANMKQGLDYVLVSYYEDDCNGLKPNWQAIFDRLGKIFPNAKIGVGEMGTTKAAQKEDHIKRYYQMVINHPRYVGGHFWWYYKQDMVPKTKPLWSTLNNTL